MTKENLFNQLRTLIKAGEIGAIIYLGTLGAVMAQSKYDNSEPSDYAIVLGTNGGNNADGSNDCEGARVNRAAALYKQGFVRSLILSGDGNYLIGKSTMANRMLGIALKAGVNRDDIQLENTSHHTDQEAEKVIAMMSPGQSGVVVPGADQNLRAFLIFLDQARAKNIRITTSPATDCPRLDYMAREAGALLIYPFLRVSSHHYSDVPIWTSQ